MTCCEFTKWEITEYLQGADSLETARVLSPDASVLLLESTEVVYDGS